MHWNLVYQLAIKTTQKMKDLQFEFIKATEGIMQPTPLSVTCAETANNYFGFAISYNYVVSNFDKDSKNDVIYLIYTFSNLSLMIFSHTKKKWLKIMTMIANLKTAFKSLVDNATWMDSATGTIAKDKVDYIIENIGITVK